MHATRYAINRYERLSLHHVARRMHTKRFIRVCSYFAAGVTGRLVGRTNHTCRFSLGDRLAKIDLPGFPDRAVVAVAKYEQVLRRWNGDELIGEGSRPSSPVGPSNERHKRNTRSSHCSLRQRLSRTIIFLASEPSGGYRSGTRRRSEAHKGSTVHRAVSGDVANRFVT